MTTCRASSPISRSLTPLWPSSRRREAVAPAGPSPGKGFFHRALMVNLAVSVAWHERNWTRGMTMRKAQIGLLARWMMMLTVALAPAGSALAQDTSGATHLMLETGGHMSKVWRVV